MDLAIAGQHVETLANKQAFIREARGQGWGWSGGPGEGGRCGTRLISALGRQNRWISMSLRSALATERVPG